MSGVDQWALIGMAQAMFLVLAVGGCMTNRRPVLIVPLYALAALKELAGKVEALADKRLGRTGGLFAGSYACAGALESVVPVDLRIPGCPPTPLQLLEGLLALLEASAGRIGAASPKPT